MNLAIIIPAYNEATIIGKTLKDINKAVQLIKQHSFDLVVVDDGSTDRTSHLARPHASVVLRHRLNRGLGAALATGIEYARRQTRYDAAITFDSDGQHDPKDIATAIVALEENHDVVIGSRFLNPANHIPFLRRLVLHSSNIITMLFFNQRTTDSQSGFRAMNRRALESIRIKTNRMEVSSEFFSEIRRHNLTYTEIPITVTYTDYSLQKGQTNLNSFKVLIKLIYKLVE